MSNEFDRAMRLAPRRRGDDDVEAATELTRDWTVGEAVNGGVLMALAGTALRDLLGGTGAGPAPGHVDPLALSAHFLSAATPGPASVGARVLRRGRSVSTGEAGVAQPGPDGAVWECMRALATYGLLPDDPPVHRSIAPPAMPSPQDCLGRESVVGGLFDEVSLGARADLRVDPRTSGWGAGTPSMTGTLRGWWRFADGREPDVIALLFALDALPPVAFDLGLRGWAPTLEFSAHLRGRPAPGWLRILVRSENLIGDLVEEDVWIWDSRDRLVAQSRQLAQIRLPGTGVPTGRYTPDLVALTIGIVGLPNVGKSTMFNALTKNDVLAANYPFATIDPNVGVVPLPDPRLEELARIFSSDRILPATVSFVDIAGIVRGASEGEGLGNKFLANIREADAICQVIRAFVDDDVAHIDGVVSPASDIETIHTELILADLQTIEKAVPRLEKEVKGKKTDKAVLDAVLAARRVLDAGDTLFAKADAEGIDATLLRELGLMTTKPFLYVFNVDEDQLTDETLQAELSALVAPAEAIFLDAKLEMDLAELEPDEAAELLESVGVPEPGLEQLAHKGFRTLGLQTYLTGGPKEARAWTIRRGWTAPQAAGVIHTDFQKGFIKAEIVSYDDLVAAGSMAAAKAAGRVRMEGKDYVMADGDVVEFRHGGTSGTGKK